MGECERMNLNTPKWTSTLGIKVSNFQKTIAKVKTHWIEDFFILLENFWKT
jgi:hypothetical protein